MKKRYSLSALVVGILMIILLLGVFVLIKPHMTGNVTSVRTTASDDCALSEIKCVDDTFGATQEYSTIQACANVAVAGDTCLVWPGSYDETIITKSGGANNNYITFKSNGALIFGANIQHDFTIVDGFNITNGANQSGIYVMGNNSIISNNYIYNISFDAAIQNGDARPVNISIIGNKIYHSQYGIIANGQNWLVENNTIRRLYKYTNEPYSDADYIRFFGSSHIFRRNLLYDTSFSEIGDAHVDCFQTYDHGSAPYSKNITIEENICLNFSQGLMAEGFNEKNSSDFIIKNNIFAHAFDVVNSGSGIHIEDVANVTIVNNVFMDMRGIGAYIAVGTAEMGKNGVINNNIFYNVRQYSYMYFGNNNSGDYNLMYLGGEPCCNEPRLSSYDISGQDPLFVDVSAPLGPDGILFTDDDGFRLQNNSPAIGVGENGVDIGAYKYVNETTPSTICENSLCESGENCSNCAADCRNCVVSPINETCGNGYCNATSGENCSSCVNDCEICPGSGGGDGGGGGSGGGGSGSGGGGGNQNQSTNNQTSANQNINNENNNIGALTKAVGGAFSLNDDKITGTPDEVFDKTKERYIIRYIMLVGICMMILLLWAVKLVLKHKRDEIDENGDMVEDDSLY